MDEVVFNLDNEEYMNTATNFVEKYADFVENLPFDLQRHVTRFREIDCAYREILIEIETLHENFAKEINLNVSRKSINILIRMQSLLGKCRELGDEKISLMQQITELIENRKKAVEHSSHRFKATYRPDSKNEFNGKRERLDYHKGSKRSRRHRPTYGDKPDKVKMTMAGSLGSSSYSRFNIAASSSNGTSPAGEKARSSSSSDVSGHIKSPQVMIKAKDEPFSIRKSEKFEKKEGSPVLSTSSGISSGSSVASPPRTSSASTQKLSTSKSSLNKTSLPTNRVTITSNNSNGTNKNSNKGKKKKKKAFKTGEKPFTRSPSPQPDYPIDPDEPTYCLCEQVSFGQMIGCDNKKCPIEWFHFSCVGLTHKPKGKWFCPDCTRDMKDRKKDAKKEHR